MLPNARLIEVLAERLRFYQAKHIVLNPAYGRHLRFHSDGDQRSLNPKKELLPLAELVTLNIPEAEILSERKITTPEEIRAAAEFYGKTYHCAVLIKGGHSVNTANDLLLADGQMEWLTENHSKSQHPWNWLHAFERHRRNLAGLFVDLLSNVQEISLRRFICNAGLGVSAHESRLLSDGRILLIAVFPKPKRDRYTSWYPCPSCINGILFCFLKLKQIQSSTLSLNFLPTLPGIT